MSSPSRGRAKAGAGWPDDVRRAFKESRVRQVAYVPDAGLARLIELLQADPAFLAVPLASEEEGVAMLAGAWLGGERGALLMQSSGVGNSVNALAMVEECRFPLLMLVAMRGEWGEFNPWQVPMGRAAPGVLAGMGVHVRRTEEAGRVGEAVAAAAEFAFASNRAVAVLLSQRLIGGKAWR